MNAWCRQISACPPACFARVCLTGTSERWWVNCVECHRNSKLESYQRGGTFAATEFLADVEGRPGDPELDNALAELVLHAKWVRVLGKARAQG